MPKRIDSVYFHFPFCAHLCNYCDFYKKVTSDKLSDYKKYHEYLQESYNQHEQLIKKSGYSWSHLQTVYIGGGTPSLWGKEGKIFLEDFFKQKNIFLKEDCEFTLEVNPGAWTEEALNSWRDLGVNRYSLGIQTLNPQMITYLDRVHSIEDVFLTLDYFKENHFNFSVDFMLGLPYSKEMNRDVIAELQQALNFNPSHFSVYILTVKDNYPYFKNLPDEDWIADEFLKVSNFLKENGFIHYEVSNFSLPGKQSIHNLNYWKSSTVAAFGPSATGFLSSDRLRYKWKPNSPQMDIEQLTDEEYQLEKVYMGLRSEVGLEIADLGDRFIPIVQDWKSRGLAIEKNQRVFLNSEGFLILDSLIDELFSLKLL